MKTTVIVLAVLALAASTFTSPAAEAKKPNIIFILADDLGWGDLGCYGHPFLKTPNLDRMAGEGSIFTQFYVNAAVCSPSRAAFLTGVFPGRIGLHTITENYAANLKTGVTDFVDPNKPFLTRLLKKAGYATGHFGKWHLSGTTGPSPADYGIDDHLTTTTTTKAPTWKDANDVEFRPRSSKAIIDESIRFVRAHTGQPFYLNVWFKVPHAPLMPTEQQMKPYARFQSAQGQQTMPFKSTQQVYYGAVTDMDVHIGRLLAVLDELKLRENTLIVFSSDNGPEDIHLLSASHCAIGSPGPFRGRKRSLYEGGTRVPFVVRWPGKVPAGRIDESSVVSAVDWLPTVCHLAGVPLPGSLQPDGEVITDILKGQSRTRRKPLLWEWRFKILGDPVNISPMLAIRDGNWKLLLNPDRSRVELYDIPRDPMELNNQAAQYPDEVARLSETALAWSKKLPPGPVEVVAGKVIYPWPGQIKPLPLSSDTKPKPSNK